MTGAESARETARQANGNFGAQEFSSPEVHLTEPDAPNPAVWKLEVGYNDGGIDVLTVGVDGKLPSPHRSDSRFLTQLLGFRSAPFSEGIGLSLSSALTNPIGTLGMHPVFDTTEDSPTTLFGKVKSFIEA